MNGRDLRSIAQTIIVSCLDIIDYQCDDHDRLESNLYPSNKYPGNPAILAIISIEDKSNDRQETYSTMSETSHKSNNSEI